MKNRIYLGGLLVLTLAPTAFGQAVQSVRGLAVSRDSLARIVDSLVQLVSRRKAVLDLETSHAAALTENSPQAQTVRASLPALETDRLLASETLDATGDYDRFVRRYKAFKAYDEGVQRSNVERESNRMMGMSREI